MHVSCFVVTYGGKFVVKKDESIFQNVYMKSVMIYTSHLVLVEQ
jgi:hypothetical protein